MAAFAAASPYGSCGRSDRLTTLAPSRPDNSCGISDYLTTSAPACWDTFVRQEPCIDVIRTCLSTHML
jgi:hypothetical protein